MVVYDALDVLDWSKLRIFHHADVGIVETMISLTLVSCGGHAWRDIGEHTIAVDSAGASISTN